MPHELFLAQALEARAAQASLRALTVLPAGVDFCSNDYLGLARLPPIAVPPDTLGGATGSRLISGNLALFEAAELFLAAHYCAQAALLFNSGYDANIGFWASVPQRGDTVLYDKLSHASTRDGLRLGFAQAIAFAHNDLADLEAKLKTAQGRVYVSVETLYSMDGDAAPLPAICDLCDTYGAALVLDEAHSTGIMGQYGAGMAVAMGLEDRVFARLHTFGKAVGAHGAAWVGSPLLREYLINFARSFIYSTAMPPAAVHHLLRQHSYLQAHAADLQAALKNTILYYKNRVDGAAEAETFSPIQSILVPGNAAVVAAAAKLQAAGVLVKAIRYPTVPKGEERLRICLHTYNTADEIDRLAEVLR